MKAASMDTREIIERMVTKNPKVTAAEIARKAKVSRERVRQLLNAMGWELRTEWRKVPTSRRIVGSFPTGSVVRITRDDGEVWVEECLVIGNTPNFVKVRFSDNPGDVRRVLRRQVTLVRLPPKARK